MLPPAHDWSTGKKGTFGVADYAVFGGMLSASLAIGVYYAFRGRNKANDEFLLGGRSLTWFPASMSLLASYVSAILVLGAPSEAYYHSIQWLVICGGQISLPIVAIVFLPLYYELQLTSVYEYLELRYNSRWIRSVAGGMFVIQMLLYEAVVIYAPALALSSVFDFPLWISVITVGLIASVYTAIGGMKAVVWTDVMQLTILTVGLVAVILKGVVDFGGFGEIWRVAVDHDRAGPGAFTFGYRPFQRHTISNIVLGGIVNKMSQYAATQTTVQRYGSMKSLYHAYMSIFMVVPIFIILHTLTMITGLVLFATYEGCDPLAAGLITKRDQILPFYVMDRLSSIPGLPGLFVACIFSGALSTISSGVNSQAAVTWEDVFAHIPSCARLAPTTQAWLTKLLALSYGFLGMGLAFLADNIGGILQGGTAVTTSVAGPLLAVFVMAFFIPFSNSKGACIGLLAGTGVALGMSFGAMSLGIKAENLPTSTHSCPVNLTLKEPEFVDHLRVSDLEYPERILGLSYTQLGPLGFTVTLLVGVIVSIATGMSKGVKVNKAYLHPCVRRFVTENDPSVKKKRTTILNNSSRSKNEEDYILTSTQM